MIPKVAFIGLLRLAFFSGLGASSTGQPTWYVDGVNGNDNNDCESSQTACKTIGRAISHSASGDFIMVAAATYHENLTMPRSLNIVGAAAATMHTATTESVSLRADEKLTAFVELERTIGPYAAC